MFNLNSTQKLTDSPKFLWFDASTKVPALDPRAVKFEGSFWGNMREAYFPEAKQLDPT